MIRLCVAFIVLLLLTDSAAAQRQRYCDGHTPYYHDTANGPGAFIADLFFFPTTTVVAVPAAALTGDAHALCTPMAHAVNLIKKRRKAQEIKAKRQNGGY